MSWFRNIHQLIFNISNIYTIVWLLFTSSAIFLYSYSGVPRTLVICLRQLWFWNSVWQYEGRDDCLPYILESHEKCINLRKHFNGVVFLGYIWTVHFCAFICYYTSFLSMLNNTVIIILWSITFGKVKL